MEEYVDAEEESSTPPFWIQNTVNLHNSAGGLLLLLIAVFLMLLLLSFNPNSVKKSWESLNMVLVLVAVVFGLLSRTENPQKSNPSTPEKWESFSAKNTLNFDHQWYTEFSDSQNKFEYKNLLLRRNSSSFPDLRETASLSDFSYGDYYRWRLVDDLRVDPGEKLEARQSHRRHRSSEELYFPMEDPETKTIIFDKLTSKPQLSPLLRSSPPEKATPEPEENRKSARSGIAGPINSSIRDEKIWQGEKSGDKDIETPKPISATVNSTQREPPPPPEMKNKSERKRSGAAVTVSKDTFNSLLHNKKNKQKQRSVDNLDPFVQEAEALLSLQLKEASPPPPPQPPPALSNKKNQRKKITVTLDHVPTPPPPPALALARRHQPETNPQSTESTIQKPLVQIYEKTEESTNSSVQSPINRIPTPPEPPPPSFLKSPAWKFVVEGDYVRINSESSGLLDLGDNDSEMTPKAAKAGDVSRAILPPATEFCPSPDVNTKAETFITKFRAKLKLERIHSLKNRELGLSNLGP